MKSTNRGIIIIGVLFFIFGFVTWANGTLIPYFKIACELSNTQALLVATAFFISYFFMALPSSAILNKTGFKKGMSLGLLIMAIGAFMFIPAANARSFNMFLFGLFIIGTGLALLQTASNPYVTILGSIESAASRISIMGICNKIAGILAGVILGVITLKNSDELVERLKTLDAVSKAAELNALIQKVVLPYTIIGLVLILLAVLIYFSGLPEVEAEKEQTSGDERQSVFQYPYVLLGALAIFFYVGVEVIAGDTIINYGKSIGVDMDNAKYFSSITLVCMLVGYVVGIFAIPKYLSQSNALKICAYLGIAFTLLVLITPGKISVAFVALLGLANSLMWPAIFPLAIEKLGKFTKIGSALLIMGIAGGALLPPLYGMLIDHNILSNQWAYMICIPCYIYILWYGTSGHKIGKG